MKYYTPQHKQLTLDLVRSSLDNLDKSNRWVQMGDNLPWPDITSKVLVNPLWSLKFHGGFLMMLKASSLCSRRTFRPADNNGSIGKHPRNLVILKFDQRR